MYSHYVFEDALSLSKCVKVLVQSKSMGKIGRDCQPVYCVVILITKAGLHYGFISLVARNISACVCRLNFVIYLYFEMLGVQNFCSRGCALLSEMVVFKVLRCPSNYRQKYSSSLSCQAFIIVKSALQWLPLKL